MDTIKKTLVARERDEERRAAWRTLVGTVSAGQCVYPDETSTPIQLTPL